MSKPGEPPCPKRILRHVGWQNWSKTCFCKTWGSVGRLHGCALFEVDGVKALYMNTSKLCYVQKVWARIVQNASRSITRPPSQQQPFQPNSHTAVTVTTTNNHTHFHQHFLEALLECGYGYTMDMSMEKFMA